MPFTDDQIQDIRTKAEAVFTAHDARNSALAAKGDADAAAATAVANQQAAATAEQQASAAEDDAENALRLAIDALSAPATGGGSTTALPSTDQTASAQTATALDPAASSPVLQA